MSILDADALETFEEALKDALQTRDERRQKTVRGLVDLMEEMRRRGEKVFDTTTVGRECEARKLIKLQSLRNTGGAPYRRLIEAYARKHGLAQRQGGRQTPMEEAIMSINDLDVRTRVLMLMAENAVQKQLIQRLQTGFKRLSLSATPPPAPAVPLVEAEILPPEALIVPEGVSPYPLADFLTNEWLDRQEWIVTDAGAIKEGGKNGTTVAPAGFVPSLRFALRLLEDRVSRADRFEV
jgi:hypothetical protein